VPAAPSVPLPAGERARAKARERERGLAPRAPWPDRRERPPFPGRRRAPRSRGAPVLAGRRLAAPALVGMHAPRSTLPPCMSVAAARSPPHEGVGGVRLRFPRDPRLRRPLSPARPAHPGPLPPKSALVFTRTVAWSDVLPACPCAGSCRPPPFRVRRPPERPIGSLLSHLSPTPTLSHSLPLLMRPNSSSPRRPRLWRPCPPPRARRR
jgi:hypothetical protein